MLVSAHPTKSLNFNVTPNFFYNKIESRDASLGFVNRKGIFTWSLNSSLSWSLLKNTLVQLNFNYHANRYTSQGLVYSNWVLNGGVRQNLVKGKLSLVFSASDIFKSLRQKTDLLTSSLYQISVNTRNSQVFYFGFVYRFGKLNTSKKTEDDFDYDNNGGAD